MAYYVVRISYCVVQYVSNTVSIRYLDRSASHIPYTFTVLSSRYDSCPLVIQLCTIPYPYY